MVETTRAFVIGGGASLKPIIKDDSLLERLNNEVVFGCNKVVEEISCDYMVFHDLNFAKQYASIIAGFLGEGGVFAPQSAKVDDDNAAYVNYFNVSSKPSCRWSDGIYTSNNTGTAALSLALCLGYNPIYLLGIDCRVSPNGESHFHDGYGHKVSNATYNHMAYGFEFVAQRVKEQYAKRKIYNCGKFPESVLDKKLIPFADLREVLNNG